MARKEFVVFRDDLDGSEDETVKPRSFAVNGTVYDIDLSNKNYEKLMKVLQQYVDAGRPQRALKAVKGVGVHRTVAQRKADNEAVRVRAKELGYEVNARGRIPATVIMAVNAGTANPTRVLTKPRKPVRKATRKAPAAEFVNAGVAV